MGHTDPPSLNLSPGQK